MKAGWLTWLRWGVILTALLAALAPTPPQQVERWFAGGVYIPLQRTVTAASNLLPIPWIDPLIALTLVALVLLWRRAWRGTGTRLGRLGRGAVTTLAVVSAAYLAFLALWGLNYRRVPLEQRLVIERPVPATTDVEHLGLEAVSRLNALHAAAHAHRWSEPVWQHEALRASSSRVQTMLGRREPAVLGRLKRSLLGIVFRWNGVDGMTNPFGLEVLGNPDLLPFEQPFVAAHEWAHLAGYADEAEANFVGWLTCLGADEASQYSGWLYLYWQLAGELPQAERERLASALDRGVRDDINAIAERLRRGDLPLLRRVSWVAYDQYLKANRVDAGVRSYGQVVTLILRARFEDGWRPVLKAVAAPSR